MPSQLNMEMKVVNSKFRIRGRRQTAYTLAEFGPTLLIAFCIIILPVLAFGMIGARYMFLLNAAREAAQTAARSKTFLVDTSPTDRSAVHTANASAQVAINAVGGGMVSLTATNTYIKICPNGGGPSAVTTPGANIALSTPADPNNNTYSCEVICTGTIQPLFPGAGSMVGSLPGFNAPMNTTVRSDCFFENVTNLNE